MCLAARDGINATSVLGDHENMVLTIWPGAEIAKTLIDANGFDIEEAVCKYEDTLYSSYLQAL